MISKRKKFYIIVAILLLVGCGWICFKFWDFLKNPLVPSGHPVAHFVFISGSSVKKAAYSLQQQKLLRSPLIFILFVRYNRFEHQFKAGEYIIEPGMTARDLIQKMIKGEVNSHAFTLVEGWNFNQVISALNNNQHIKHTILHLTPDEIMAKIAHPGEMYEGRFAPDTYLFSGDVSDLEILRKAYQLMQKRLENAWHKRDQKVLYHCPYEALIVASIIEKETAVAREKPIIAGVLVSRLVKGMRLQACPTVIYGLKEKFSGKLTKDDLSKDTPYNTYLHTGLPPSPIAMPSLESLEAALHPETTKFLYYVSKGDGTHVFSETYQGQTQAIKKYLLRK